MKVPPIKSIGGDGMGVSVGMLLLSLLDPVDVNVSINVLKIVDLDDDDYSIEIQFEIIMKWTEIRATYHNLKQKDSLNALPQDDYSRLRLPKVVYENTDQKETKKTPQNGYLCVQESE